MKDVNYSNRIHVSTLMANARGSKVYARSFTNLTEKDLEKTGYLIIEPNQYNQQGIYSCFKYFENSFQKPIFSLTNLMSDEEINDRVAQVIVDQGSPKFKISLDTPIIGKALFFQFFYSNFDFLAISLSN